MSRFPTSKRDVSELFRTDDEEGQPRASRTGSTEVLEGDYEEHYAPEDEMEEYWRLYENNPVVRMSISAFAQEVVEPGWYVMADDEETAEELTEWLTESVTVNGDEDQDFAEIIRQATVQREVRGTTLIEKVRGKNSDKVVALQCLNPETMKIYTQPRSNVLIRPDDVNIGGKKLEEVKKNRNNRVRFGKSNEQVPVTDDGEGAAYVQWDDEISRWQGVDEVYFSRDDIIKITRDADVGEVYGTSRVEAVADRVHGLQQKLKDNDEAIAQKAWPFWMFKAGPEDGQETWEQEQMDDFIESHDMDKFGPGMKQVVPGSMSVETISGETADIYESVQYDVDHISLGLPMPQHALGAFGEDINAPRAKAQNERLKRQVSDVRGELESKFTPMLKDVAEERNLNNPDKVALKIGRPDAPNPEMEGQNVIRYTSDSPQGQGGSTTDNLPGDQAGAGFSSGPNDTDDPQGSPRPNNPLDGPSTMAQSTGMYTARAGAGGVQTSGGAQDTTPIVQLSEPDTDSVWASDETVPEAEELADPRRVSIRDDTTELTREISDHMVEVRDNILDEFEEKNTGSRSMVAKFDRIAGSARSDSRSDANIDELANKKVESAVRNTLDSIGQQYHSPTIEAYYSTTHRRTTELYSRNLSDSVDDAMDDMITRMQQAIVSGLQNGDSWDDTRDRVENEFNSARMKSRAQIIAHMQLKNAVESTKLEEYENSDQVAGVELSNPCNESTTRLCEHLAGCTGEPARAYFNPDQTIASQLQSGVGQDMMYRGFTPLPMTPPFHFGCRTILTPIPADSDELEDGSIMFDVTDPVMTPEGAGLVARVMQEDFKIERDDGVRTIEARPEYRGYVVRLQSGEKQVFREEDLEQAEATFERIKEKRKKEREREADGDRGNGN